MQMIHYGHVLHQKVSSEHFDIGVAPPPRKPRS